MGARSRVATSAVSVLFLGSAVCGCGGTSGNGIAAKAPQAIVNAAAQAIHGVTSVHVSGSTSSEGSPTQLNLTLLSGKGARGEISENGLSFQIVALAQEVYINGSDAFWRHFGGEGAVQLFHGRWLKAPASGQFASLASLTNLQELFGKVLSNHGTLAKGPTTTVNGEKVVPVEDTTHGGTLYVATTGKPYPVELLNTGSEAGRISFDRYNEAVSLTAPANAVDISELH